MSDFESAGNVASWRHGAAGAILSTAASSSVLAVAGRCRSGRIRWRRCAPQPLRRSRWRRRAPAGIDPQLFARAKAALDQHQIYAARHDRHRRFLASRRASRASTSSTSRAARSRATASATAAVRIPTHSGYRRALLERLRLLRDVERHLRRPADYYDGKYGLSMKVRGLDWSNNNAEPRAIVIHNAWYAEDDMIPLHGTARPLGRLLRDVAREPVRRDAPARRRPHDLRRQARLSCRVQRRRLRSNR